MTTWAAAQFECLLIDERIASCYCRKKRRSSKTRPPAHPLALSRQAPSYSMEGRERRHRTAKAKPKKEEEEVEEERVLPDIEDFSVEEVQKIRASLLRWYDTNQRVLPWRSSQPKEKDGANDEKTKEEEEIRAYAVWVSEVMLQQTRVAKVIDYYNRWMQKWPTLYHLANASQEEVNEMWAGLGYYRRARFLLEGAKSIVEKGGKFPGTVDTLRRVKGIGDYTAGAIASIAFNQAVPVVDGNVTRVVCRLKAISANPKDSATEKCLWKLAGQLVDPIRPGDFNQALMELGSTVCTRSSPACSACPISYQCRALLMSKGHDTNNKSREKGTNHILVTDYPMKVAKAKQRHNFAAVCVLQIRKESQPNLWKMDSDQDVFLLKRRPNDGLLAGLWEFPSVLLDKHETDSRLRRVALNQYLKRLLGIDVMKNCKVIMREDIGEYVHIFSHIRLHMSIEWLVLHPKCGLDSLLHGENQDSAVWKTVDGTAIRTMGLTSGVRKVYHMMEEFKQSNLQKGKREVKKRKKG
ncbi:adenine DNA glycosylase [Nymphaea colorata]|nr:adenine DNA glycosylase [Nymphaea colorata]